MKTLAKKTITVLNAIIFTLSILAIIYATVMQIVLKVQKFGFWIGGSVIIPHWSLWLYLNIITMCISIGISNALSKRRINNERQNNIKRIF